MRKLLTLTFIGMFSFGAFNESMEKHIKEFNDVVYALQEDFESYSDKVKDIKTTINNSWKEKGYDKEIKDTYGKEIKNAADVYCCQGDEYEAVVSSIGEPIGSALCKNEISAKLNSIILSTPLHDYDLTMLAEYEYLKNLFDQIKLINKSLKTFAARYSGKIFVH